MGHDEVTAARARKRVLGGAADLVACATIACADQLAAAAINTPGQSARGALAKAEADFYGQAEMAHRFYWAAFVLVGDGGGERKLAQRAAAGGLPGWRTQTADSPFQLSVSKGGHPGCCRADTTSTLLKYREYSLTVVPGQDRWVGLGAGP